MIYWGKNYKRFFDVFIHHGATIDLRPIGGRQIGEKPRVRPKPGRN
jgi:hypothetical protein